MVTGGVFFLIVELVIGERDGEVYLLCVGGIEYWLDGIWCDGEESS